VSSRGVTLAPLLALLLALTGCGGGSSSTPRRSSLPTTAPGGRYLNPAHIAFAIEQSIRRQRDLRARVSCPTRIPKHRGRKFVCVAKTSQGQTPFVVTEISDAGNVSYVGK
jgi:hypothetical protein